MDRDRVSEREQREVLTSLRKKVEVEVAVSTGKHDTYYKSLKMKKDNKSAGRWHVNAAWWSEFGANPLRPF